jgi:hypothetical protein
MQRMLWGRSALIAFLALGLGACSPGMGTVDAGDGGNTPTDGSHNQPDTGPQPDGGPSDGGGGPACGRGRGACNPVDNSGCTSGQACQVYANTEQTALVTMCGEAGSGGYGTMCTQDTECMETFTCLGNRCVKLCCGAGDDETCRSGPGGRPGATCNGQISTMNGGGSGLFFCSLPVRCDWFTQTDCAPNETCSPTRMDGTTECREAGTASEGMECGSARCEHGYVCISTGADMPGYCRRICDPTGAATEGDFRTCPTGFTCGRVNMLPTNFGICAPMAGG